MIPVEGRAASDRRVGGRGGLGPQCWEGAGDGVDLAAGIRRVLDRGAFHRRILPLVERVDYDYMEVSSPGADRPLKTGRDFERAAGTVVEVKTYRAVNGAKTFAGTLEGLVDGEIVIVDADGQKRRFDQKAVAVVRPLIEFDEEDLQDDVPAD